MSRLLSCSMVQGNSFRDKFYQYLILCWFYYMYKIWNGDTISVQFNMCILYNQTHKYHIAKGVQFKCTQESCGNREIYFHKIHSTWYLYMIWTKVFLWLSGPSIFKLNYPYNTAYIYEVNRLGEFIKLRSVDWFLCKSLL